MMRGHLPAWWNSDEHIVAQVGQQKSNGDAKLVQRNQKSPSFLHRYVTEHVNAARQQSYMKQKNETLMQQRGQKL